MLLSDFEEILSWQKAQDLSYEIYKLLSSLRDFSFRDQIQRASVSISNNIAEGFERKSNSEFKYFLYVAKGSCGELRSMLTLGKRLGYIDEKTFQKMYTETKEISKLIGGLIKSLK
ncbi:MAG: four helix bundle protein [Candidatus Absconditabacterales bacterium]